MIDSSAAAKVHSSGDQGMVSEVWEKFKKAVDPDATPERVCAGLSRLLHVQQDGVALLRLQKNTLAFLFPARLRAAGTIPLSSPAVAARTAATKTTLLSNNFAKVRHATVFEGIKLDDAEDTATPTPIQKLISVPIFSAERKILGVVQISRKGTDTSAAGPDFTHEDLHHLEDAAALIAQLPWMQDSNVPLKESVEGL